MKKLTSLVLMIGLLVINSSLVFGAGSYISEGLGNCGADNGFEYLNLACQGQEILPTSNISWIGQGMLGYSRMGIDFIEVSSGNVTTLNVQPIFQNGVNAGVAQTITAGTDLTVFKSPFYRFTFNNNVTITTNVTFNFNIGD